MRVGIVGATGAVGRELVDVLGRRAFPVTSLRLFASARSAGTKTKTPFGETTIEEFSDAAVRDLDLALLAVSGDFAKAHAPKMVEAGVTVVDNSSAFRLQDDVPLVVPEVNGRLLGEQPRIVANPNCVAAIAVMALAPLNANNKVQRVIGATYQSASGAGAAAMAELEQSTAAYLAGEAFEPKVLPHPYAFNLFSHNAGIDAETGYNGESSRLWRRSGRSCPRRTCACRSPACGCRCCAPTRCR